MLRLSVASCLLAIAGARGTPPPEMPDASVEIRTALGLVKVPTFTMTISGGNILLTFAGATDMVATDVVTWEAWE